jgi:hypothetical protein
MTKQEKQLKETKARLEFDRRMAQLQSTMPPSEDQLLKAVGAVPLSPSGTEISTSFLPSATDQEPVAELVNPEPESEPQSAPSTRPMSPYQRAAARANTPSDPKMEALLDTVAQQVKALRGQRSGLNPRVLVKVDSDIFSRVSNVAYARRLDKIEVLTYLLSRYLPQAGREEPPSWLAQARPDDVLNSFHLVYQEDSEIAPRFTWLEQRFGLLKVDIVAAIVTRYLPASPFVVPPKRRPKRKRF